MKVLFVGEIVGDPGRRAVKKELAGVIAEYKPNLVLSNIENLSGGRGATVDNLNEVKQMGVDYFTSGDHIFWQKGTEEIIDDLPLVIPANYPQGTPGKGFTVIDTGATGPVLLINLMGRTSFNSLFSYLDDPFRKADEIIEMHRNMKLSAIIIDFHADSTSEKAAFGFYMDGRVTAIVGSHTHVPTADNICLPKGTLFVTDVGMTGNIDTVLGVKKELIINMFLTARNQKFEWENAGRQAFRSVLFDTEAKTIIRIDKLINN